MLKAIRWLVDHSDEKVESDGIVSRYFEGTLPRRMVDEIVQYAKENGWNFSDGGSTGTYSFVTEGETQAYYFTRGSFRGTYTRVHFYFEDYTNYQDPEKG